MEDGSVPSKRNEVVVEPVGGRMDQPLSVSAAAPVLVMRRSFDTVPPTIAVPTARLLLFGTSTPLALTPISLSVVSEEPTKFSTYGLSSGSVLTMVMPLL